MTITLPWYLLPVVLVLVGVAVPVRMKARGDYDFVTPILRTLVFLTCVGSAIAFCFGRWTA